MPSQRRDPSSTGSVSGDLKSWVAAFTLSFPRQLIHLPPTHWKFPASPEAPDGQRASSAPAPAGPLEQPGSLGTLGPPFPAQRGR